VARPSWPCFHGLEARATAALKNILIADAVGFKSQDTKYERRTTLKLTRLEKTVSLSQEVELCVEW
jgi:hypothetical protein